MSFLLAAPFAHRGLHDLGEGVPENSLAAFEAAASAGVAIELDVQLSRDGRAIVVHDDDLRRLTGRALLVSQTPATTVTRLAILDTDQTIPSLATALGVVAGRVPVMIEIKNHGGRAGRLEAEVAAHVVGYDGDVCVASFNPRSVAWFRDFAPTVVRGQTAGPLHDVPVPAPIRHALRVMAWNRFTRPDYLSYDLRGLPNEATDRWRAEGLPLLTWTVRDDADLAKARRLADNFIYEAVSP